jgi:hypothetical protein
MDKRTAKRKAYSHAAGALDGCLAEGWPLELCESEEEYVKISEALRDIIRQLGEKGE